MVSRGSRIHYAPRLRHLVTHGRCHAAGRTTRAGGTLMHFRSALFSGPSRRAPYPWPPMGGLQGAFSRKVAAHAPCGWRRFLPTASRRGTPERLLKFHLERLRQPAEVLKGPSRGFGHEATGVL